MMIWSDHHAWYIISILCHGSVITIGQVNQNKTSQSEHQDAGNINRTAGNVEGVNDKVNQLEPYPLRIGYIGSLQDGPAISISVDDFNRRGGRQFYIDK